MPAFSFSTEEFVAVLERAGFVETDSVSPEEQVRRYLQGRDDIPDPPPNSLSLPYTLLCSAKNQDITELATDTDAPTHTDLHDLNREVLSGAYARLNLPAL